MPIARRCYIYARNLDSCTHRTINEELFLLFRTHCTHAHAADNHRCCKKKNIWNTNHRMDFESISNARKRTQKILRDPKYCACLRDTLDLEERFKYVTKSSTNVWRSEYCRNKKRGLFGFSKNTIYSAVDFDNYRLKYRRSTFNCPILTNRILVNKRNQKKIGEYLNIRHENFVYREDSLMGDDDTVRTNPICTLY